MEKYYLNSTNKPKNFLGNIDRKFYNQKAPNFQQYLVKEPGFNSIPTQVYKNQTGQDNPLKFEFPEQSLPIKPIRKSKKNYQIFNPTKEANFTRNPNAVNEFKVSLKNERKSFTKQERNSIFSNRSNRSFKSGRSSRRRKSPLNHYVMDTANKGGSIKSYNSRSSRNSYYGKKRLEEESDTNNLKMIIVEKEDKIKYLKEKVKLMEEIERT